MYWTYASVWHDVPVYNCGDSEIACHWNDSIGSFFWLKFHLFDFENRFFEIDLFYERLRYRDRIKCTMIFHSMKKIEFRWFLISDWRSVHWQYRTQIINWHIDQFTKHYTQRKYGCVCAHKMIYVQFELSSYLVIFCDWHAAPVNGRVNMPNTAYDEIIHTNHLNRLFTLHHDFDWVWMANDIIVAFSTFTQKLRSCIKSHWKRDLFPYFFDFFESCPGQ